MRRLIIITAIILGLAIAMFYIRGCYFLDTLATLDQTYIAQERLDSNVYTQKLPHDYSSLFQNRSQIKVIRTVEGKRNSPISEMIYNDAYYIQVYKVDSVGTASLDRLIMDDFKKSNLPYGVTYMKLGDNNPFTIEYKIGPRESSIAQLYFSIHGLDTKIIQKNDSLLYYYTELEDFSIKYNRDSTYNIFSRIKRDSFIKKPVEILFLRRSGKLYFLLLANISDTASLSANRLYDLIQW